MHLRPRPTPRPARHTMSPPDKRTVLALTVGVIGYAITITLAIGLGAAGVFSTIANWIH